MYPKSQEDNRQDVEWPTAQQQSVRKKSGCVSVNRQSLDVILEGNKGKSGPSSCNNSQKREGALTTIDCRASVFYQCLVI